MVYIQADAEAVTHDAIRRVMEWLGQRPGTAAVSDVRSLPECQSKMVDIIWSQCDADGVYADVSICVRGDLYGYPGEYRLEMAPDGDGVAGISTAADYLYYCFLRRGELHILPLAPVRRWVQANAAEMMEPAMPTLTVPDGGVQVGRLVSRERLLKDIGGISVVELKPRAA